MKDVSFTNTRFDPDITPFHDLAKSMATAFGYTADLELDAQLAQLLRLRVAQINACSYCLILHTKAAHDRNIEPEKISGLGCWWESALYADNEKAALAYCDALTKSSDQPGFQSLHDAAGKFFSDRAIAEIAAIVINMNLWTRLKLAQGATPQFG